MSSSLGSGRAQKGTANAGVQDPDRRGTRLVKAESLSVDQRIELSNAVDELAHWLDRAFWRES